jgi:hypothetical protein
VEVDVFLRKGPQQERVPHGALGIAELGLGPWLLASR